MFLKIAFFMLLSLAFFVVIVNLIDQAQMPSIQLTKYKKIKDNCQAVKVNETFHCTLFSDLIYLLDLEDLIGTLMMVKIPIQDCADPEYFLDWIGMVCRLKFNGLMACSRDKECSGSRGLICSGGVCQCKMPNEKYKVI